MCAIQRRFDRWTRHVALGKASFMLEVPCAPYAYRNRANSRVRGAKLFVVQFVDKLIHAHPIRGKVVSIVRRHRCPLIAALMHPHFLLEQLHQRRDFVGPIRLPDAMHTTVAARAWLPGGRGGLPCHRGQAGGGQDQGRTLYSRCLARVLHHAPSLSGVMCRCV